LAVEIMPQKAEIAVNEQMTYLHEQLA